MWFRIELDKAGAIRSCEQVAQGFDGSKYIRYVEAETKADACSRTKEWWARRRALDSERSKQTRLRRIASGLCEVGCKRRPRPGHLTCAECASAKKKRSRDRLQRLRDGNTANLRLAADGEEGRLKRERENVARGQQMASARAGGHMAAIYLRLLMKLDEWGPERFRAWLIEHIPNYSKLSTPEAAE